MAIETATLPAAGSKVLVDRISPDKLAQIIKLAIGSEGALALISGGGGNVDPGTVRVTLGADDPAVTALTSLVSLMTAQTYELTTEPVTGVRGGAYFLTVTATNWGGATVTLQALGAGSVWLDITSLTANGVEGVGIGEDATLRLSVTGGTPTSLAASLT